ncbi:lactate/malate dehydrogenase [Metarhizium robertsii]|uniref:Lactate/malate dehydrogenase n=2 Tax=Metarhizium robertsii TaxID=568076 RepID=E9FAJ5_METRA|nr:lactate/malate dehydrogenase [Metarhizium robertsii ARSEF 23]EFY95245.1 lactate/malate dehydrogenase [Metarhizium robertsii ARSEF 23]EXU96202.1 lactate/malate dehydrogenase [Metarhizium robertsii]
MSTVGGKPFSRIAVIGVGEVGGAAAFALIISSIARELLLVDINTTLRDGQVRDLSDVAYSSNSVTRVRAATHHEAGQCDIVVITAGSKSVLGQPNLERVYRNVSIIRNVVDAMKPIRQDAIVVVVSNPVDLATTLVLELSKLPQSQVLGAGTFLDSVRIRGMIADEIGVAANSLDVYVLGVHGDPQVVAWSTATIGGVPLDKSLQHGNQVDHERVAQECKDRSRSIIRAKGANPFGISSIVCSICASILLDKRNVRPVSCFRPGYGCCFSWPVVLGRKGIIRAIDVPLNNKERADIDETAKTLKATVTHVLADG